MIDFSNKSWEFKYSPKNIDDLILPEKTKKVFRKWFKNKDISNTLFVSNKPGCGKTSITRLIIESRMFSTLFINASRETSIDNIRYNVNNFVSTVAIIGRDAPKIVILDEADRLSSHALDALKGEIERAIGNARFIFTANRESAFPEPIISRLRPVYNFDKLFSENKQELYKSAFVRISHILNSEGVKFDSKAIVELIKKYAPDWRSLIRICQMMSAYDNTITMESVNNSDVTTDINDLIDYLKEKDFRKVREFSVRHMGNEHQIIQELFKLVDIDGIIKSPTQINMIQILSDTNRNINIVPDKELEVARMLTDIMVDVEFN